MFYRKETKKKEKKRKNTIKCKKKKTIKIGIGFVAVAIVYPLAFVLIVGYNYVTGQNYIFETLFTVGLSNVGTTSLLILTGFIATVACLFYTIGTMNAENAIWVPIMDNSEIPLLYVLERTTLGYDYSNWMTYLGSSFILLVVLYLSFEKYLFTDAIAEELEKRHCLVLFEQTHTHITFKKNCGFIFSFFVAQLKKAYIV